MITDETQPPAAPPEPPPDDGDYAGPEHFEKAMSRRYDKRYFPGLGWFRAQSLSELERSDWETYKMGDDGRRSDDGMRETKAALIVRCGVNAKGERRFTDEHAARIAKADSAITAAVFEFCCEHVGIHKRDVDAIAALCALQKKSLASPG